MTSSFVSDYVFNLSKKVLSQTEINVLEKGLGFSPTPSLSTRRIYEGNLTNPVER